METALARAEVKSGDLADLEAQLTDDLSDIVARWDDLAAQVEPLEVPLEKSDVSITATALVWIPTAAPA